MKTADNEVDILFVKGGPVNPHSVCQTTLLIVLYVKGGPVNSHRVCQETH